jgi:hypothetical protein
MYVCIIILVVIVVVNFAALGLYNQRRKSSE